MQKWLVAALVLAGIVVATATLAVPASQSSTVKDVPVTLRAQVINNVIVLTAVTPIRSRNIREEWMGPEPLRTRRFAGNYVSKATLEPLFSGQYGIIYRIWQVSPSGLYEWQGYAWTWLDVTVAADGTVIIN